MNCTTCDALGYVRTWYTKSAYRDVPCRCGAYECIKFFKDRDLAELVKRGNGTRFSKIGTMGKVF
jgi:hypothetical protein